jgi:hypothetical protein
LALAVAIIGSVCPALRQCRDVSLASMRGSVIWFVMAAGWGLDCVLALIRHNLVQAGLTGFFAGCFLLVALFLRKREEKDRKRWQRGSDAGPPNANARP